MLAASKSPGIKVNQILFRKVNLGMFGPSGFYYYVELQLTREDVFKFGTILSNFTPNSVGRTKRIQN